MKLCQYQFQENHPDLCSRGRFCTFPFYRYATGENEGGTESTVYPNLTRMTTGERGELCGTEYLICKQIIRDHDEFVGRRGCRINAEPLEKGGFVVYFTLPRYIKKFSRENNCFSSEQI